jgi:hypothetical protein
MKVADPNSNNSLWTSHDCADLKDVVPICQYPQYIFSEAFPTNKGKLIQYQFQVIKLKAPLLYVFFSFDTSI